MHGSTRCMERTPLSILLGPERGPLPPLGPGGFIRLKPTLARLVNPGTAIRLAVRT
jgi:hypothetical protein